MIKSKAVKINWLLAPELHDYPAAFSYLSLLYDEETAKNLVDNLRVAEIEEFHAKDIFRASKLSLLGVSNSHVIKDKKKIKSGKMLSPLLLIRDPKHLTLIIADGYHRLCSLYLFDEDAIVLAKIVTKGNDK